MEPTLEIIDCHTYYDDTYVLHGVSVAVQPREVSVLIGRNGMGKTTLVRSIIGLSPPRNGIIRFKGKDIAGLKPEAIARLGIGLVPQGRRIFPSLRVHENLQVVTNPRSANRWTIERVYERFPRLKERSTAWGDQLSGGEQQMLAIGRALMTGPECLLMDEPFEGLAPAIVDEVMAVIRQLIQEGTCVLLVEQRVDAAVALADHVYVMGKGTVVFEGTKDQFLHNIDIRSSYLGVT